MPNQSDTTLCHPACYISPSDLDLILSVATDTPERAAHLREMWKEDTDYASGVLVSPRLTLSLGEQTASSGSGFLRYFSLFAYYSRFMNPQPDISILCLLAAVYSSAPAFGLTKHPFRNKKHPVTEMRDRLADVWTAPVPEQKEVCVMVAYRCLLLSTCFMEQIQRDAVKNDGPDVPYYIELCRATLDKLARLWALEKDMPQYAACTWLSANLDRIHPQLVQAVRSPLAP